MKVYVHPKQAEAIIEALGELPEGYEVAPTLMPYQKQFLEMVEHVKDGGKIIMSPFGSRSKVPPYPYADDKVNATEITEWLKGESR